MKQVDESAISRKSNANVTKRIAEMVDELLEAKAGQWFDITEDVPGLDPTQAYHRIYTEVGKRIVEVITRDGQVLVRNLVDRTP